MILPIDAIEHDVKNTLTHSHLIVEAETGSGKSTRLPIWAMEQGRVLVVEPRRIACTSLAEFVAESLGDRVGKKVGYAIKLENRYCDESNIVFVTPGVALRWYADNQLADFSVVVVDEFHERRWDTDLLVALLKQKQSHRTIITSATIEGEKLASYFDATRLVASGRVYNVDVVHRREDSRQLPDSRYLDSRIKQELELRLDDTEGDVLVFLPGRKEIQQVQTALISLAENRDLMVTPLHASVSDEQRARAMTVQSKQKVVLATNVAETSLTIPNISLVIDSGLERRNVQRNGQTTLMLTHISKASAAQRCGRAGRVMNGVCVRLYGEHAALEAVTPPELQRESIVEPMLAAAVCGHELDALSFIDNIPDKSLVSAKAQLFELGAIDQEGITEHGLKLAPLPIDAIYADLVTKMPTRALKEVMIDLTAAICTTGKLYQLTSNEEALERLDQEEKYGCDAELMVGLVRGHQYSGVTVEPDALREAQGLAEQMRAAFELPSLEVASRYNRNQWLAEMIKANSNLVFVRRERRRDAFGNGHIEVLLGRASRLKHQSEAALVLSTHSLPGRGVKQTMTLGTLMVPVELNLLREQGVGEWVNGDTEQTEQGLVSHQYLVYAGRKIGHRTGQPQGEAALEVISKAIVEGKLYSGLAEKIGKQMQHFQLYCDLGLADTTFEKPIQNPEQNSADDLTQWFYHLLVELGVESQDDLELIDASDFVFDGIPEWEYQDFVDKYPLEVQLSGLTLTVQYFGKGKLVEVSYSSGSRKEDPKRKELPAWSGWRVKYRKASRVLDLR